MSDFRDKLGRDLDNEYETFVTFLKEAMQAKRKVWHSCPKCKNRSEVEIMDVKAGLQAAQLWANEGHGKAPISQAKPLEALDLGKPIDQMTKPERDTYKQQLMARLGQQIERSGLDLSAD
jgi:hypothetical protein